MLGEKILAHRDAEPGPLGHRDHPVPDREILLHQLEGLGAEAESASSGAEALPRVAAGSARLSTVPMMEPL